MRSRYAAVTERQRAKRVRCYQIDAFRDLESRCTRFDDKAKILFKRSFGYRLPDF